MTKVYLDLLRKKERTQINKIINERDVTTDITEMQRIIRDYYEQLYTNKLDNLEETDKFLKVYNLPRINHEEIESVNVSITNVAIESVIKSLPIKKTREF